MSWLMVSKKHSPNYLIFSVFIMFFRSSYSARLISTRYRLSGRLSPRGLRKIFRFILSDRCRFREGSSSFIE